MPGKHISAEQRRNFMDHINNGDSVTVAASRSGLSRASGFNIVKEVESGGGSPRKNPPRPPGRHFRPSGGPHTQSGSQYPHGGPLEGDDAAESAVGSQHEAHLREKGPAMAGGERSGQGGHIPSGQGSGPDGDLRLYRSRFTQSHHKQRSLRPQTLSLQASVVGFHLCPRGGRRGKLDGVLRRSAKTPWGSWAALRGSVVPTVSRRPSATFTKRRLKT